MPQFNPQSEEWYAALRGVREMCDRTSQTRETASQPAPAEQARPTQQAPSADTAE
ncbi:hypothetical protein [Kitasatospora sp. NPDC127116]|uniref:hypothetical protein n=1 Tax=Kitasatospora sp. NPDC127116 TaxID=3345367 RepID=UPI0036317A5C